MLGRGSSSDSPGVFADCCSGFPVLGFWQGGVDSLAGSANAETGMRVGRTPLVGVALTANSCKLFTEF